MENYNDIDILGEYKKMLALNKSFEARLDEYARILKGRDEEIEMLQEMLNEATSYRSSIDNQVNELKELQRNISQLQQNAEGSSYIGVSKHLQVGETVSTQQQLVNLQLQYTYLQTQLSDLQAQCLELNNRNLLLQQHTTRIAELESLLANAEEEITELKR
ncbi:MAG: hypothetical protein ABIN67_00130 [Ferruginibacter sp.]